jgi:hypothetical protein
MNKQTKTIIGLAAVAGIGYYIYTQNKKKNPFANALGKEKVCYTNIPYPHRIPCEDPRAPKTFASAQGKEKMCYTNIPYPHRISCEDPRAQI